MAKPDTATQTELDQRLQAALAAIGAKPHAEGFGQIAQSFNTAPARAIRGLAGSEMFSSGVSQDTPTGSGSSDPSTQTGEELLTQLLGNYSDQLGATGVNLQDIKAQLAAQGIDLTKKGIKSADILNALTPMGLQSNVAYKMAHPNPINSSQMQQLLGVISGYQKPYLDAMGATANLGAGMTHDFAKYLSPQSRAAYGDLTSAYQNEAKTLQNVIPAENPAAILNMLGGGTATAAPTGVGALAQLAGLNPATLTAPTPVKTG